MTRQRTDEVEGAPVPEPNGGFRKLVEESPDGILVVDRTGCVRFANSSAKSLLRRERNLLGYQFGYPAFTNQPVELVIDPTAAEPTVAEMWAVELDWEGSPALLVNLRDITARKHQERRIAHLNSALRTILEVEELILRAKNAEELLREACRILICQRNYHAAAIIVPNEDGRHWITEEFGNRQELSLTRTLLNACPPCAVQARQQPFEPVVWEAPTEPCKGCVSANDCTNNMRLVATLQSDGEVFGFLSLVAPPGTVRDPEELELIRRLAADLGYALRTMRMAAGQKKAEDQLRDSEARFRQLFENCIDAIVIADASGRYLDANPAACDLLGYTRTELRSMSVADLDVTAKEPPATRQWEKYLSAEYQSGVFSWVRPDGRTRTAEYSAFPLLPGTYASVLRDVTERRALEEQLRQAQKMEAVGRLAGGIAHDFNNLLCAIISFATFIRDDTPAGDRRRDDISEVLRAAYRAASLTEQLLAFSRRQPIAPQNVDLSALVRDTHRLLARILGEDIAIRTALEDDLWPVFVDPGQFTQVILNLAVNARDAMPAGGELVIETQNVEHAGPPAESCVLLRVADNGVGMSDDIRAHIFEPFFTTKEEGKGTGLGLSTVYGLVAQAGGRIAVQSQPGGGTCFEIRLPRASSDGAARAVTRSIPKSNLVGSEGILVVEDDPMVRTCIVRILRKYGYRVLEASGGSQALAELKRAGQIDMLLCDVVMPQTNGVATARELKRICPQLKVVFMSGYAEATIMEHGAGGLGVNLLSKPFSEESLLLRIRQVLSDRSTETAAPIPSVPAAVS